MKKLRLPLSCIVLLAVTASAETACSVAALGGSFDPATGTVKLLRSLHEKESGERGFVILKSYATQQWVSLSSK